MTNHTLLSDPQELIGKQWRQDQPPERTQILGLARDALGFISATGQRYRFEDFQKSLKPDTPSRAGAPAATQRALDSLEQPRASPANLKERFNKTVEHFTKLQDESGSTEERRLVQIILDALHFISSTDQYGAFGDYLDQVETGAPPYVVASFDTTREAEAWLRQHPSPPVSANILIANSYHDVVYDRDMNSRHLPRNRDLEYYLAELKGAETPVAIASFRNLEEADAWLQSQPAPARWTWVSVGSEFYVAAYYPNIKHRALYPLSMAEGYDVASTSEAP